MSDRGSQQQQQQEGQPPTYQQESDDIVQVVYQSNQSGALVGVESALLSYYDQERYAAGQQDEPGSVGIVSTSSMQQLSRAASTLPSVAEESSSGTGCPPEAQTEQPMGQLSGQLEDQLTDSRSISGSNEADFGQRTSVSGHYSAAVYQDQSTGQQEQLYAAEYTDLAQQQDQSHYYPAADSQAIYSMVNRAARLIEAPQSSSYLVDYGQQGATKESSTISIEQYPSYYNNQPPLDGDDGLHYSNQASDDQASLLLHSQSGTFLANGESATSSPQQGAKVDGQTGEDRMRGQEGELAQEEDKENNVEGDLDEEISGILSRHKPGVAESGSFRDNFKKKKLGASQSTNETHLEAHRQKLLESQEANNNNQQQQQQNKLDDFSDDFQHKQQDGLSKFKRTHSVSFNVKAARSVRHSVDIRNLPSYLTVKRASIVDVARGAMSSLIQSFGGSQSGQSKRDSFVEEEEEDGEPIFEEPIAPTLSLGQRVAMVKNSGAEFGTVGWIGQLPEVDDDWIVGVVFDNMIGNCDGAHNGVRYFYARDNHAMFVPMAALTKTDNYIGRPETGTMLSRMSVSLKPGQLISIQRSSLRLQHCFLNAPHQRVGHDVRAVSNRLHCQCHNCGPCAHLTKQGRVNAMHAFGAHHAPNKKNSLAHAAVEILAHHHHHYHEEEHSKKNQEESQFGDNSAHACNFVRYSCCQQTGVPSHQLSADCGMVRPELLDNLIHAPRAPHRRSRPRRRRNHLRAVASNSGQLPIGGQATTGETQQVATLDSNFSTINSWPDSEQTHNVCSSPTVAYGDYGDTRRSSSYSSASYSSGSSHSTSPSRLSVRYQEQQIATGAHQQQRAMLMQQDEYLATYDSSGVYQPTDVYNTLDTQMSLLEQRRFVYRRESSTYVRSRSGRSDDHESRHTGIGSSLRRCFACLMGRQPRISGKPKRRKMSARNRMIEYRRKQSTFVPSTLAKPQEDFASHGLIIPPAGSQNYPNSDYSSCSSSRSSRNHSPSLQKVALKDTSSMFIEHTGAPNSEDQLKSCKLQNSDAINLDDYNFSDAASYSKKIINSCDSALTDLGYFGTCTSNSNDTLKQIVDSTINEEVMPPEPLALNQDLATISPILSCETSELGDQFEVSSPTATEKEEDDEISQQLSGLEIDQDATTGDNNEH